jgi:hypothetical protein
MPTRLLVDPPSGVLTIVDPLLEPPHKVSFLNAGSHRQPEPFDAVTRRYVPALFARKQEGGKASVKEAFPPSVAPASTTWP